MNDVDIEAIGKDYSRLLLRVKAMVLIQVEKTRAIPLERDLLPGTSTAMAKMIWRSALLARILAPLLTQVQSTFSTALTAAYL